MDTITTESVKKIVRRLTELEKRDNDISYGPISFEEFLLMAASNPEIATRNIFQYFYDMVKSFVEKGEEEDPNDPENIGYIDYDCTGLFAIDSNHRFFADRIFANRLIAWTEDMKRGTQQNKIYIFDGPHGCGKSTFLNNLLRRLQDYSNTPEGLRFEVVWKFPRGEIGAWHEGTDKKNENCECGGDSQYVEIPCPSHDNPILMVPKKHRREFFDDLFPNGEMKFRLFADKEYEWLLKDEPCTICGALYEELMWKYKDRKKVLDFLYCRPFRMNRRMGEGISVFNPGDPPTKQNVRTDPIAQRNINGLLQSTKVQYVFSTYAKTNNGLRALMDVKSYNVERLKEQHNIVSERVHRVEDIEETADSLLIGVMNPEDKKVIDEMKSLSDRIQFINISYVLDYITESGIYKDTFGEHIEAAFLPRVFQNFAKIIIATRLSAKSPAMFEWIEKKESADKSEKYEKFCDKNLQLLKMFIYCGNIPDWLNQEDRKRLNAKRRRRILAEADGEGKNGISGRDSIRIFGEFYSQHAKPDRLINLSDLAKFVFKKKELKTSIPDGFLDSLMNLYDFSVLQEMKESLFYYNDERISYYVKKWMYAITCELKTEITCPYVKEKYVLTRDILDEIEKFFIPRGNKRLSDWEKEIDAFRSDNAKIYSNMTLAQEMRLEGKTIKETKQYKDLFELFTKNVKAKALDPFVDNSNFRNAIKDYGKEGFKTYDRKIRDDVCYLFKNLIEKFGYTEQGAQEIAIYVIDNDLAKRFKEV
ncbi:MAG: serine protein kinase PrkA [Candidatus Falkowbacteria bacterium]